MRSLTAGHQLKIAFFVAATVFMLLTGCGQKGDLYQPASSLASSDARVLPIE